MFGSNPGVCNVESTPVEAAVPVSGVGGGRGSFFQFGGRWPSIGKCVVLAAWEEVQAARCASSGHQGDGAAGDRGAACGPQGAPPGAVWLQRLPSRAFPLRRPARSPRSS